MSSLSARLTEDLNLLELLPEGDQQQNPFLFDGDTIKIERAEETPSEAI
jgi:polysaccharide export outer membrane protein